MSNHLYKLLGGFAVAMFVGLSGSVVSAAEEVVAAPSGRAHRSDFVRAGHTE